MLVAVTWVILEIRKRSWWCLGLGLLAMVLFALLVYYQQMMSHFRDHALMFHREAISCAVILLEGDDTQFVLDTLKEFDTQATSFQVQYMGAMALRTNLHSRVVALEDAREE